MLATPGPTQIRIGNLTATFDLQVPPGTPMYPLSVPELAEEWEQLPIPDPSRAPIPPLSPVAPFQPFPPVGTQPNTPSGTQPPTNVPPTIGPPSVVPDSPITPTPRFPPAGSGSPQIAPVSRNSGTTIVGHLHSAVIIIVAASLIWANGLRQLN